MDIPRDVQRRLDEDHVVWLTTVTGSGAPSPNPVWFVQDGDDIVVFSAPDTHKVRNVVARPLVTLTFTSSTSTPTRTVATSL